MPRGWSASPPATPAMTTAASSCVPTAPPPTTTWQGGTRRGLTWTFRSTRGAASPVSASATVTLTANTAYWIRFRVQGNVLAARIWKDGTVEPTTWDVSVTDTSITGPGSAGIRAYGDGASWNIDHFTFGSLATPMLTGTATPTLTRTVIATLTGTVVATATSSLTASPTPAAPTATATVTKTTTPTATNTPLAPTPIGTPFTGPTVSGTVLAQDSFRGRTVSAGWGTAGDGSTWNLQAGTSSTLSVSGNEGHMAPSPSSNLLALGTGAATDAEGLVRFATSDPGNDDCRIVLRADGSHQLLHGRVERGGG